MKKENNIFVTKRQWVFCHIENKSNEIIIFSTKKKDVKSSYTAVFTF